jgi:hypothetical protein
MEDEHRRLWQDTWPTRRMLLAHLTSGAVGGSIAVSVCLFLFMVTYFPIDALVAASPLGWGYTYERGYSLAATAMMLVLPLVFAAAVAGPIGACLTSGLRRALRSPVPVSRQRSSVLWAVGVAVISGCVLLWGYYPITVGRLVALAVAVGVGAAGIGALDALLSQRYAPHR